MYAYSGVSGKYILIILKEVLFISMSLIPYNRTWASYVKLSLKEVIFSEKLPTQQREFVGKCRLQFRRPVE